MPISPQTHAAQRYSLRRKMHDKGRPTSTERGYNTRWRKYRQVYLAKNPLCVECKRQGRTKAAAVVDHIEPHKGDMTIFWDQSNHQGLCTRHHNRKTMLEMRNRHYG